MELLLQLLVKMCDVFCILCEHRNPLQTSLDTVRQIKANRRRRERNAREENH